MKAISFDGTLSLIEVPPPRLEGEVLVEVIYAGICNTDLEVVKGYAGFHGILGHEFVGRVAESPDSAWLGRRVVGEINVGCMECDLCRSGDPRHCPSRTVLGIKDRNGAFAEFLSLPACNLVEVPSSISNETAVFVEPLAAAARILDQVEIGPSSAVAVVGDGKLGQLIVRVVASLGCRPTLIGKHEEKLELARKTGARLVMGDALESELKRAELYDVVIDASGSASGLGTALGLVKPLGKVVLKSTHYGATTIETAGIVVNEVSIIGSRCGRFGPAIDLLSRGAVRVEDLISYIEPLDEGIAAFGKARSPGTMKVLLRVAGR